ncbi:SusC/RagA family TonB-linked outer membrane protein [Saccharicrinis sp. GN24d3]|uniref:SusC/RagA family TonB-linked outer membrane protein n=1 Tax=Saccharicrinis sp. GN24d3 TaxID=3458416 RepID=UPI004035E2A9
MKKKWSFFGRSPEVSKQLFKKFAITLFLLLTIQITNAGAQKSITGAVVDDTRQPLPGVSVIIKGTSIGTVTSTEGIYNISNVPEDAILVFSFIGMTSQEVVVGTQTTINVTMLSDYIGIEEVVAVGYGTKKKINLTGAISVAGSEELEARPVANVQQALQGVVPNLTITTSSATGEPGADMAMNIRGLTSIEGDSEPYVLVDGIPMDINDIDPNDIESISVLKDVASTAIYGARAAYGVILITTKNGKANSGIKVSYSSNYAITSLINMPKNADPLSFAYTMNEARENLGSSPYYSDEKLEWIAMNMKEPGSAPEVLESSNGLTWNLGTDGLNASAATDWHSIIFKDYSSRTKHNLNLSGGNETLRYYLSGGFYDEKGQLKQADDFFKRYNIDGKINATINDWMKLSFLTKYKYVEEEYPEHKTLGRSFIMLLTTRLKPTKPAYYPGTEVWTGRIGDMEMNKTNNIERQLVLSPRITLEPVKNWVTNIEVNYRTNDNRKQAVFPRIPYAIPDGTGGSTVLYSSSENTEYRDYMYSNHYFSPNIYTEYSKAVGSHNFHVLGGYQHEVYNYNNLFATAAYLLTDEIPSLSTAVGEKTITDGLGHWSTQSVFGRFNYNFAEKYLIEFNGRYDGSSKFENGERWGFFPSVSTGWIVSKENFFPLKDAVNVFKLRGSYGSVGNQNVSNYLYIPTMSVGLSNWLFSGEQLWGVGSPDIESINLTWEEVKTMDFGFDLQTLNNRLGVNFDWYESKTTNLVGPGKELPEILGTDVPKINEGEVTTRGWEIEISWKDKIKDFSYNIRAVLSDYQSEITSYNNPTKILSSYYEGQKLNEIWGMETDGFFQSELEVDTWALDQSDIYSGAWAPGDLKYVDQDGDDAITIGDNTKDNPGDKKVIGNSTPRFQFGLNANASWKGFDFSFLIQGVGKRDLDLRGLGTFRGPSNGQLHANVYTEHLDYWRDDSSPLGANPDAYFPAPYVVFTGQNDKNYRYPTTRFLQNGAYVRLKNVQVGYTIPKLITEKVKISNARIYLSGENLLTFTDLMIYDPEAFNGRQGRVGDQYPLSRAFSLGLDISF